MLCLGIPRNSASTQNVDGTKQFLPQNTNPCTGNLNSCSAVKSLTNPDSNRVAENGRANLKKLLTYALGGLMVLGVTKTSIAADLLDPTPVSQQAEFVDNGPARAVDAFNVELSLLGGGFQRNVLGTASNAMFNASLATPMPFFNNFGAQLDLAIGSYDGSYTSSAAGLHLFWRDPSVGALGIYGDWAYTNPEHAGRVGVEAAYYDGRWTYEARLGMQFGQHVYTRFIDEIDISYYFTDNTRGSIGHRLTSRGHVANLSFEHNLAEQGFDGWTVFGEIEGGEDNYFGGHAGISYTFGSTASTLIDRDRKSNLRQRHIRSITSVTQCGILDTPKPATHFRSEMTSLCASESEINEVSSTGIVKQ